jgi:hypothetical protein
VVGACDVATDGERHHGSMSGPDEAEDHQQQSEGGDGLGQPQMGF